MHKNATASHLVLFYGIGDGHLVFSYQPHVTVDTAMIGEVEGHLFLAWRVGLVIAVVGFDGDDAVIAYGTRGREVDGDG